MVSCAAVQDFLTSSYLLTSKDCFYTRAQMGQLICQMGDALSRVELPQPALIKPLELWTGKQVFSMLVRPSSQARYDFSFLSTIVYHEQCCWLSSPAAWKVLHCKSDCAAQALPTLSTS